MPKCARKILGYHKDAADRVSAAYARDEVAEPLRLLDDVIRQIRAGSFAPDASRSGLRAPSASPSSATSTTSAEESAPDEPAPARSAEVRPDLLINDAVCVLHSVTAGRLTCGGPLPHFGRRVSVPPAGARECRLCFR